MTKADEEKSGTVAIEVEGTTYVLVPDFNALCELQAITGKHPIEVMTLAMAETEIDPATDAPRLVRAPDLSMARACVWAYLQDRHADEIKTVKDAGKWIARAGGLEVVDAALNRLATLNADPGDANTVEASPADPQPAAVGESGTGKS